MENENELKEYCNEIKGIKVKEEPIEYDVNIDDKGNVKLEEFDNKKHVQNHETLDAEDCTVSCKVEVEESCVCVEDFNIDYNVKHDASLVTQNIEKITESGDILYNCPKCTYTSNSYYNYKRHVQRHDDIRNFVCTVCNRRFYDKQKLRLHEFIHSGQKVFECSLCDYGAIRKDHFTRHVQNKHRKMDEKKFKCPKCNYQTNNKQHLSKHHFVHEEERPHVCNVCNRQFKSAGGLKAHEFFHDEEKRYQCAHCDYSTKAKASLVMHLQNKHLGLKSEEYECSKCTFKTIHSYALKRHFIRRHLKNVEEKFT